MALQGYQFIVQFIVGTDNQGSYAESSRYVDEAWLHSPTTKSKEFQEELSALLTSRDDIGFIFPIGENELLSIIENYQVISRKAQ